MRINGSLAFDAFNLYGNGGSKPSSPDNSPVPSPPSSPLPNWPKTPDSSPPESPLPPGVIRT